MTHSWVKCGDIASIHIKIKKGVLFAFLTAIEILNLLINVDPVINPAELPWYPDVIGLTVLRATSSRAEEEQGRSQGPTLTLYGTTTRCFRDLVHHYPLLKALNTYFIENYFEHAHTEAETRRLLLI